MTRKPRKKCLPFFKYISNQYAISQIDIICGFVFYYIKSLYRATNIIYLWDPIKFMNVVRGPRKTNLDSSGIVKQQLMLAIKHEVTCVYRVRKGNVKNVAHSLLIENSVN